MPPPANDLCVNAINITSLPFNVAAFDNTDATESVDDPTLAVLGDGTRAGGVAGFKTVWWKYTPVATEVVHLEASNSNIFIGVYTGSCGAFYEVMSWNPITIELTGGTQYYFMVCSATNTGYTFDFDVDVSSAPANQSPFTAQEITELPFTDNTIDLSTALDNSTSNQVWFKYTANSGNIVLGIFAYGASFTVMTQPYDMNPVSLYPSSALLGIGGQNKPIQIPVEAGVTYYIHLERWIGTASTITFNVQNQTALEAVAGSFVIPDDASGFPVAILDRTTGEVLQFKNNFVAGEQGDILASGVVLTENAFSSPISAVRYDVELVETNVINPFPGINRNRIYIRANRTLNKFYTAIDDTGSTNSRITTVNEDGTLGVDTWILPSTTINATIAANNDGSIVYLSRSGDSNIKRWDTAGSAFLSDGPAFPASHSVTDMLFLSDDTLIVLYFRPSTDSIIVRAYDEAGVQLGEYTTTSDSSAIPKLAYDNNDDTIFWLWKHEADGIESIIPITVSTMTAGSIVSSYIFEGGVWEGAESATPTRRFGNSFSCPFFLLTQDLAPPPDPPALRSGIYKLVPNKRNDTLWTQDFEGTEDVKIPDPFAKTAYVGS